MADAIVTLKIMPETLEIDLALIEEKVRGAISKFGGNFGKSEQKPVAFGINALNIIFIMDEQKGSTEELEKEIAGFEGVQSCEAIDVRRALG